MKPRFKVVIIDDRMYTLSDVIRALEKKETVVVEMHGADQAWEFFEKGQVEISAVILDVMMPPGERLKGENHQNGLRTGLYLYQQILKKSHLTPVAIFSNSNNAELMKEFEIIATEKGVLHSLRRWGKADLTPKQFADQFVEWLDSFSKN